MRSCLRKRIQLLVAATVVGVILSLLYVLYGVASKQIDEAVSNKVRTAAYVVAQLLKERSQVLTERSYRASESIPRYASFTETCRWAKSAAAKAQADVVMVTDERGQLIGDSSYLKKDGTAITPKKRNMRSNPAIKAAMQDKHWQGVVVRGKSLFLAVAIPVKSGTKIRGTITTFLRLDGAVAKDIREALDTDVAFVHGGKVVASSLESGVNLKQLDEQQREVSVSGRSFYTAYAQLPGSSIDDKMGIVALDEMERTISPYRNLFAALLLSATAALCVALLLGYFVGKNFTSHLQKVVAAATQLKKGDWPEPFNVKRKDEIGQLQSAFNEMTAALRRSHERLLSMIDADPLTGLDNHRKFQEKLDEEVTRTTFTKQPLSLMLLDIDKFQEFNNTHGHAKGDAVLARTAKLIRENCPEEAVVSRYGGEEFAVLLPNTSLEAAEALADQIRLAIEKLTGPEGKHLAITLSIGCTQLTDPKRPKSFVLTAELAVTRAKQLGRNRVCRFDNVPGADEAEDPYQLHRFLQDGSFATIQALAAAVDAKDPYTQGHSQRVAEYGRDLAKAAGYTEDLCQLVFTAGTLHDVGKVGVPDEILKKPGRLTDEERAIMETHPVLGEIIVRKAPHLADTLPGVRHHHERYDGKGYPDNLAGEDIPLLGRILAVADMFDAMTSDRPYRKGLHLWEALWEIERQAGTQLDPKLATTFVAMMRARTEWTIGA